MLDQTTKRKLDSARQILVGKVPDPKAQVEQITTALVYKFMDDMDKESEELGGEAKFFANGFSQYAWTKLLDNKLSGQERLDLYVQAITNMSKNPHIPQLFRDIFKGAFLPYNDPRTLSLFLKEINEFDYEHSENLGNAFEYLLSILGSQGDAGQFRTPRHIIDFIVEVVDPKKNETILDPACGTAGFLISAYKHILKTNKEKPLTPDEKLKLMNNLAGYDISPDMVKLALVNMYLHGFPEPKIHEYDTLSSEKRWDETFDVIMANPPFMTPKGGIVPHKRFSIQANRAEVLFVDYIVEHLTIKGRAGIIVPEGIIFQSNNAYTQLRKKLVEDGLFAVVSLPAGVFNPYAGVKTSILLFDNEISKKTKNFLFVKIQNDGFDLGAQRREHKKNDLPFALEIIKKYKSSLDDKKFSEDEKQIAHIVAKEKIIATGDYNLSGERYKEVVNFVNQKWPIVKLGTLCSIKTGKKDVNQGNPNGKYPFFTCAKEATGSDEFSFDTEAILIAGNGDVGAVKYYNGKFEAYQRTYVLAEFSKKASPLFLYYFLNSTLKPVVSAQKLGNTMPYIKMGMLSDFGIPLPPIEVQKEIVEQIEVKQNAIDHAKAIIQNLERERRYFGQALRKLDDVEVVKLTEICGINQKTSEPTKLFGDSDFVYIDISSVENGTRLVDMNNVISTKSAPSRARRVIKNGDVLLSTVRPNLKAFAYAQNLPEKVLASTGFAVLTATERVLPKYIFNLLFTDYLQEQMIARMGKGSYPSINQDDVKQLTIPLPALDVQKKLVAEAEKEQEVINANKQLIEIMDQKISDVLSEI